MQIGHGRAVWPVAILKELIDNSLDACEIAGTSPYIEVAVGENLLSVRDNGPGLPKATLERSLDYLVRVSDKAHYVSPTRGRLGNALKCVWAAPFVVDGQRGLIDVSARGQRHRVTVGMDAAGQKPEISLKTETTNVKTGTFFEVHWPQVARCLGDEKIGYFYNARRLLRAYAVCLD